MKTRPGKCTRCGSALAKSILPGSIRGGRTTIGWQWEASIREVCTKCVPQPCMVTGCNSRASEFLRHKYDMGKGRASVNFRNDVFVCHSHLAPVKRYRLLKWMGQLALLLWLVSGVIVFGVFANSNMTTSIWWWYLFFLLPSITLFFLADRMKLSKKQEYHMPGIGEYGSRWADDGFSAPFIW